MQKITIGNRTYEPSELTYLAYHENLEDTSSYYYYKEILFSVNDGTFILVCHGNSGSRYSLMKDFKHAPATHAYETDHIKWLLSYGHKRLAGLLFPELRDYIEKILVEKKLAATLRRGEVFYQAGEVKGEVKVDK